MVKNDNPHALRLMESMKKHHLEGEAEQFAQAHPLSKSASVEKRFEWAQHVCETLNEHCGEETVKAVRMDCACGPELGKGKKLKDLYEKEADIAAFAEKANKLNQGFTMEYDGESLFLIYPQCYCSCVKRIVQTLPAAWCYCTLGYTKRMFEYIFGKEVQTELISSVKMGGDVCRIKIRF